MGMNTNSCECPDCGFSPCISFCPRVESAQVEREREEDYFATGDARRCPIHPGVKTSSDDGMHDCDCGLCEAASEEAYQAMLWDELPSEEKAAILEASRLAAIEDAAREAASQKRYENDEIPF